MRRQSRWRGRPSADRRDSREHWDTWWTNSAGFGCSLKNVPWLHEYRMSFAEKTRAFALRNLEDNANAIREEAKGLGINVDGGPEPTQTEATDKAVGEQNRLAIKIRDAHAHQKELLNINVGYHLSSWGTGAPWAARSTRSGGRSGTTPMNARPTRRTRIRASPTTTR